MIKFFLISILFFLTKANELDTSTQSLDAYRSTWIDYNESKVIVWEKCGVSARTKISPIFKTTLNDGNKLSLFYNPSLNSLVFENKIGNSNVFNTSVARIPENDINTLFLSFKDPAKLHVYIDCPSTTKHKFYIEYANLSKMTRLDLFTNAEGFDSMEKALESFQCRSLISVAPGSVVQFNGLLMSPKPVMTTPLPLPTLTQTGNPTLIYSFNNNGIIYSFNYLNGMFQIISSNGSEILINTTRPVPPNGFYLIFANNGLFIYDKCPHHNNQIGFWPTDMFRNKFRIETSRVFSVGNGASDDMLETYCSINSFFAINNTISHEMCIPANQVQNEMEIIQKTMKYSNLFLPNKDQMLKMDTFKALESDVFPFLVNSEHRILFASRQNAPTRFFNRPLMDYVEGFSDGQSNFWIGLDTLNKVTSTQKYGLRIEIVIDGILYAEEYSNLIVDSKTSYKIILNGLKTPSLVNFWQHNNTEFSTFDSGKNALVAKNLLGGFWHTPVAMNTENYYCFSCETGDDQKGSFYDNPEGTLKDVRITKMYLIV